jgi:NitT/TauT family transport system substrate-binding protein/sulfonate transport system substrate-binding protein
MVCGPVSLPASAQEGGRLKKIRIGTTTLSMSTLPAVVARKQGFYLSEGLEAELIVMGPSVAMQGLIAGDLHFVTTLSSAVRAAISGMPIRAVMIFMTGSDQTLVVKPQIQKVEDLRGKVLGVPQLKGPADIYTRAALRKHGLVPDSDVSIIVLGGGTPLRLAALQAGKIDGTMLSTPQNKMAVKMGLRELVYARDIISGVPSGFGTNIRMMQNDPESIVRTTRATLKALRFIKENKEGVLKIMATDLGINDREIANLAYDDVVKLYSDSGIPSENSILDEIAMIREMIGTTRDITPSQVADWSFAREAGKGIKGSQ